MWKAPRRAQARERTSLFLGLSTACSILSPPLASRGKRSWGLHILCPLPITWPRGRLEEVPQWGCGSPRPLTSPTSPARKSTQSHCEAAAASRGSEASRRAGRGPRRAARGGHRPPPTSSSSVTVFLQLCSRVVKLEVVSEL